MQKLLILLSLSGILFNAKAQRPEVMLAAWGDRSPIEKVYLHLDKGNYLAGETIWFKAYLGSDYQPDTISTALYVELLNASNQVLNRKTLPILFGATNGHLEIPDSLLTGSYVIRSWTTTQLNHEESFLYEKPVFIFGKRGSSPTLLQTPMTRIEFFPEGGNLVNGMSQTVAFKASDVNGLPVNIEGALYNEKNEKLQTIKSYHDGMGMFDINVAAGHSYHVELDADPTRTHYDLPVVKEKGIALSVIPHPQGAFFEIHQAVNDPIFQAAYMIGQMQHHIVFRQEFKNNKTELQGVLNTRDLHSGILQVTVFNKDGLPLAERLFFVNNKEYMQQGELLLDSINFNEKAKNHFQVKLYDTVQGNFSVAVSDADFEIMDHREENIYTRMLLTSDIRGYVHDPAYFFRSDNDSVQTALDLVMMTNGWRRFSWTELAKQSSQNGFKDPGYINLAGRVTLRDVQKSYDLKPLLVFITGSDSARNMLMTKTDRNGYFSIDSLLFFGSSKIMFSDSRGKNGMFIDVRLSADSIRRNFSLPLVYRWPSAQLGLLNSTVRSKMMDDYDAIVKANGIMMDAVTIKAKKKSPIADLEERYTSGMFSGFSEKTYDLSNTKETESYGNIFDYLQFKVPGLEIGSDGADYTVYYRQGPSISAMGEIPMTLFLNEIETDANTIATISASDIALVKVFSHFSGASGNGAGGTLAIYTKKGDDLFNSSAGRSFMVHYNGFSVIKEFYSPNYTVDKTARSKSDTRITLQWKPDIMVSGVNPIIPVIFHNNDRTKKYRITVEGMTYDGKLLMIERTISR